MKSGLLWSACCRRRAWCLQLPHPQAPAARGSMAPPGPPLSGFDHPDRRGLPER